MEKREPRKLFYLHNNKPDIVPQENWSTEFLFDTRLFSTTVGDIINIFSRVEGKEKVKELLLWYPRVSWRNPDPAVTTRELTYTDPLRGHVYTLVLINSPDCHLGLSRALVTPKGLFKNFDERKWAKRLETKNTMKLHFKRKKLRGIKKSRRDVFAHGAIMGKGTWVPSQILNQVMEYLDPLNAASFSVALRFPLIDPAVSASLRTAITRYAAHWMDCCYMCRQPIWFPEDAMVIPATRYCSAHSCIELDKAWRKGPRIAVSMCSKHCQDLHLAAVEKTVGETPPPDLQSIFQERRKQAARRGLTLDGAIEKVYLAQRTNEDNYLRMVFVRWYMMDIRPLATTGHPGIVPYEGAKGDVITYSTSSILSCSMQYIIKMIEILRDVNLIDGHVLF